MPEFGPPFGSSMYHSETSFGIDPCSAVTMAFTVMVPVTFPPMAAAIVVSPLSPVGPPASFEGPLSPVTIGVDVSAPASAVGPASSGFVPPLLELLLLQATATAAQAEGTKRRRRARRIMRPGYSTAKVA